eukprot:4184068-Prymnesium_polylepis.2
MNSRGGLKRLPEPNRGATFGSGAAPRAAFAASRGDRHPQMPSGGYGTYEIGRSKKYKGNAVPKSSMFKSETKMRPIELDTGDPG